MMDRLMLIVRIADEIVALPSAAIESVVEIETMGQVPLAPPHVAGLAALRSRVVTIIDPRAVLGIAPAEIATALPFSAVVVTIDGHPYGIMVDEVLDVLEADGPPRRANGLGASRWQAVATGTVIIADRQHLLIDPAALIVGGGMLPILPAAAC